MGKYVDRNFVVSLVDFYYREIKNHFYYRSCLKCQRLDNLLNEMEKWSLALSIFIITNVFLFIIYIILTLFYFQFSFEKNAKTNCN